VQVSSHEQELELCAEIISLEVAGEDGAPTQFFLQTSGIVRNESS